MIRILLGWDGLGVVSYLLVVYYQNPKSRAAGIITAITNRLGDVAILLIIGFIVEIGSWNFIFSIENSLITSLRFPAVLIILARITKRAQMPFSAWLPAAMAAPTPVSALVHSSTLVTAGVYLLIRFRPVLAEYKILWILFLTATLTTIIARVRALHECDLKKVVALSTLSQLGIIVITLAAGFPLLSFFHLLTHATFKALLFMCRGKIIHEIQDSQEIRKIGTLWERLPVTSLFINLSNLALCGFPFLAGFYSKDLLVETILIGSMRTITLPLIGLRVGLSAAYSARFAVLSLISVKTSVPLSRTREEDSNVLTAYIILGRLATTSGAILSWLLMPLPEIISIPSQIKIIALVSTMLGLILGVFISTAPSYLKIKNLETKEIIINIWLLPNISGALPRNSGFILREIVKSIEHGWAELFGGQGSFLLLKKTTHIIPSGAFSPSLLYQLVGGSIIVIVFIILVYLNSLYRTRHWKCRGVPTSNVLYYSIFSSTRYCFIIN